MSKDATRLATPVRPGDRVFFRPDDPAPGDTERVAALALGPKNSRADGDFVRVVVTEPHVVSRDPRLRPDATLRIRRDQIVVHEIRPQGHEPPLLRLSVAAGKLVGIRRVDGRTAGVHVVVDELESTGDVYTTVDHVGMRTSNSLT